MPNLKNAIILRLRWFTLTFAASFAFFLVGCTTSELDESERALVAKQQLADKFDRLFNLAFESPQQAEEQFNQLVFSDLVTDDHNLLADDDVRAFQTLVQIAVRLNRDIRDVPSKMNQSTLFDMYIARNQLLISSGSTLYELPYRLRSGERYERLKALVAQVGEQTQKLIDQYRTKMQTPPKDITATRWSWSVDLDGIRNDIADLNEGVYKTLKDFTFDFTLNTDNTVTAQRFFLLPAVEESSKRFDGDGDWREVNMSETPMRYATYGNKIFFRVPMENTANFSGGYGDVKREWYYEFTYQRSGRNLVLSQPRIGLFVQIKQFLTSYADKTFDTSYPEPFKQITLTPKE